MSLYSGSFPYIHWVWGAFLWKLRLVQIVILQFNELLKSQNNSASSSDPSLCQGMATGKVAFLSAYVSSIPDWVICTGQKRCKLKIGRRWRELRDNCCMVWLLHRVLFLTFVIEPGIACSGLLLFVANQIKSGGAIQLGWFIRYWNVEKKQNPVGT